MPVEDPPADPPVEDPPADPPVEDPPPEGDPDPDLDGLDDKALAAIRKRNKENQALRQRAKTAEDALETRRLADLSEQERKDELAKAEKGRADKAEDRANRLEVAIAKGLTTDQADRLKGSTVEELTADADVLLASFKTPDDEDRTPPRGRPRESLRPGAVRDAEPDENDPVALASKVSRNGF